jgi:enoyl-CoA hydratase
VSPSQLSRADGLRFQTEDVVANIIIDNEGEQNRLSPAAIEGLGRAAAMLQSRDDLHVIVIRGAGRQYFSTGMLNPVLRASMAKDEVIDLVMRAGAVFDAIENIPQVIVAGLNGAIRAGGVELALACDIRIAAEHVR